MSEPLNPDGTVATDVTEIPAEVPPESQGERNRTLGVAAAAVLGALLVGAGLFWLVSSMGGGGEPNGGQATGVIPTRSAPASALTVSPSVPTSAALPTATVGGRDPFAPVYVTTNPSTAAVTSVPPSTIAPTTVQPTFPPATVPTYPTYYPSPQSPYVPPTTSFPSYSPTPTLPATPTPTGSVTPSGTSTATGGPSPSGSGSGSSTAAPTLPPAAQYTVQLVGLDEAKVADITINDVSFSASPGDVMGPFKYQNATSSTCISMLFGDVTFPVCVGEAVVLNA